MLDSIVNSETGAECRADVFRLLLHLEYNRRHNLPKPRAKDWQGSFRLAKNPGRKPRAAVGDCVVRPPQAIIQNAERHQELQEVGA